MFSFHLSCCVTVWRWLVVVESNFVYGNTATAVPHFIQEQGHKKRNKTQPQKDKGSVPSYRYLKRPLELEYWRFKISLYLFKRVSFRQANPTNRRDTSRRPKHFGKIHSDTDFKLKYFFSLSQTSIHHWMVISIGDLHIFVLSSSEEAINEIPKCIQYRTFYHISWKRGLKIFHIGIFSDTDFHTKSSCSASGSITMSFN